MAAEIVSKQQQPSPGQNKDHSLNRVWAYRGINGTHIHVRGKHLPKYLGEFQHLWNMRQVPHLMLDRLLYSFSQ